MREPFSIPNPSKMISQTKKGNSEAQSAANTPPPSNMFTGTQEVQDAAAATAPNENPVAAVSGTSLQPSQIVGNPTQPVITNDNLTKFGQGISNIAKAGKEQANTIAVDNLSNKEVAQIQAFEAKADEARLLTGERVDKITNKIIPNSLLNNVSMLHNPSSMQINNLIRQATSGLNTAESTYLTTIRDQCPIFNKDNKQNECNEFKNLQKKLVDTKFQEIMLKHLEEVKEIIQQISINNEEKISLRRLEDLLKTRIRELSQLQKTINTYMTDVQRNSRNNFYELKVKDSNKDLQKVLIFYYYLILLFYFFISNFFPKEYYKKFIPLLLISLYISLPLIAEYVVLIIKKIIINIKKNLDIYNNNIRTF